jgi:hypothetical protein
MAHNPMATKFEDHPGHDVHDCPLREAVHPHPMGTSQRGYRCSVTGGHCVPDNNCQSKIISYYEEDELRKVVKELADQEIHENDLDVSYVRAGLIEKARRALGGE